MIQAVEYIGEALGRKPKINIKDSRIGEVTHYVGDIKKAKKILGYNPKTDLREGVLRAVRWSSEWEKNKHKPDPNSQF